MRKQIPILAIASIAVLISFVCGQPVSTVEASEIGPNTFDANGNLCIIGGDTPQAIGTPMELWAGAPNEDNGTGILVGYVTFNSINSTVTINLTDSDGDGTLDLFPYILEAVHIHFGPDVDDIPHTKSWNPILGKYEINIEPESFEYKSYDTSQSVIVVPVEFDTVGAIHLSVVQYGGLDALEYYLPTYPVEMKVKYPQTGDPSYLGMTLDDAGQMDGEYESWCGDVDNFIEHNTWYTSQVYSLHDLDLPTGLFENPENLDKVNYLINTFYVGKMVSPLTSNCTLVTTCGGDKPPEALTYGDIQVAIWTLVEDILPDNISDFAAILPWSQERVNAILCDVNINGDKFIPTCETNPFLLTAFIVVPDDGTQLQISSIEVPCETAEETAWGDGKFGSRFPDANNWGKYFLYNSSCVAVPE